jgi:hypothetical protein
MNIEIIGGFSPQVIAALVETISGALDLALDLEIQKNLLEFIGQCLRYEAFL